VTASSYLDRKLASLFAASLILGFGLIIAIAGVVYPPAVAGAAGAIVAAGTVCWLLGPARALQFFPLMLIVAGTKFRGRDATALVGGSVDSQVMFELGVYAIMAVIVVINVVSIEDLEGPRPIEIALFAYASIALASVGWSASPAITAVRASQQMMLLATVYIAVRVIEPKLLFRSFGFQILTYVVVCASLAMVFPSFNGTKIGYLAEAHRFSWFAVHPVSAATESGMALVFLTGLALFGSGWKTRLYKIPFWTYACTLLLIILATRTRTAMFSTLAAMTVLYTVRYKNNAGAWIIAASLMAGGLLFVVVAPELKQSVQSFVLRGQNASQFASLTGRTDLWKESLHMFTKRPLLGYGFVASRALLLQVLAWAGEAHNALVESLLDVGLVGATALFVPFVSGLIGSLKHLNRWRPGDDPTIAWVAGALTFLAMDGIPMASFAGFLTYDPVVMMTAVIVFQAIRSQGRNPLMPRFNTVHMPEVRSYAY
jgi:O-antigen ligase